MWDNLLKKGFHGPSFFVACREHSGTIDHLLDSCGLDNTISNLVEEKCKLSKRVKGDVIKTLQLWGEHSYQSKLLNRLSTLIQVFVVSDIWKERNKHIFNGKYPIAMEVWMRIQKSIQETLIIGDCNNNDLPSLQSEWDIILR